MLGSMTSAQFVEWIAFYELEPFGSLHEEQMAGQICAAVVNGYRDPKKDPLRPSDFFSPLKREVGEDSDEPILLDDPEAQSQLIKARVFGVGRD